MFVEYDCMYLSTNTTLDIVSKCKLLLSFIVSRLPSSIRYCIWLMDFSLGHKNWILVVFSSIGLVLPFYLLLKCKLANQPVLDSYLTICLTSFVFSSSTSIWNIISAWSSGFLKIFPHLLLNAFFIRVDLLERVLIVPLLDYDICSIC